MNLQQITAILTIIIQHCQLSRIWGLVLMRQNACKIQFRWFKLIQNIK